MTHNHIARRVALALLLAGSAIPVAAQETQPVTPPTLTPPPAAAPAPAPAPEAAAPAPAPSASPRIEFAPRSEVVQTAPPPPPPPESVAPAPAARPAARQVSRAAPAPRAERPAPEAPAVATLAAMPAVSPAPVASASPLAEPVDAAPIVTEEPAAAPDTQTTATTTTRTSSDTLMWAPLIVGALILIGLIGYLLARRRRSDEALVYEEPAYVPVEAAPAAGFVEQPAVAALDESGRPWIDVGLRPIRAGATDDAAQVELELTVSNSGDRPARDVRVSTWMLADARGSDNEQALIDARTHANTTAFDLPAGADRSVDTTLDLPRAAVNGSFRPLVVAEATYPLPDGSEGRIAATFEIGRGDEIRPIATDGMHDDLGARLHEVVERS